MTSLRVGAQKSLPVDFRYKCDMRTVFLSIQEIRRPRGAGKMRPRVPCTPPPNRCQQQYQVCLIHSYSVVEQHSGRPAVYFSSSSRQQHSVPPKRISYLRNTCLWMQDRQVVILAKIFIDSVVVADLRSVGNSRTWLFFY